MKRLVLILIISLSLLFAACGGNDGSNSGSGGDYDFNVSSPDSDNTVPTEKTSDTNLTEEEKVQLVKDILYTAYSGIESSGNCPLHNVMVGDLNELAVTLALQTFQPRSLNEIFQNEDLMVTLEEIMGIIDNDALTSYLELIINNFRIENIMTTIEKLIDNFKAMITAIQERRFQDILPIFNSSMDLFFSIDFDALFSMLYDETLAMSIQESISTIINQVSAGNFTFNFQEPILNLENTISMIRSQMTADSVDNGLLDLLLNISAQLVAEGMNSITYTSGGVTTTLTVTGLESILSGAGTEVTMILSADFDASGFILESSSCTYTGDVDGSPDFEAVIVLGIEDTYPIVDIKSVEVTAYNTLHASYPTYDVQYKDWTISYDVVTDPDNPLNASLFPMIENLIQSTVNIKDNRNYTITGGFSLDSDTYEITEMHYVQTEQNDGTLNLSINGSMYAGLMGTEFSVVVASDTIKCSSEGLWYDSILGVTIDQDINVDVTFYLNGAATIESETISLWQEILNPLN